MSAAEAILGGDCDARIQQMLRYWLEIHPLKRLPAREAFDPVDVPRLLPHIVLVDVEREPLRFLVRVMGTAVVTATGEKTGQFLDEVIDDFEKTFASSDRKAVVESGLPQYRKGPPSVTFRLDYADIERLHLPFAKDGRNVDVILSTFLYFAQDQ